MLLELFNSKLIKKTRPGMFSLFYTYENRAAWDSIDEQLKKNIICEAEEFIGYKWPRFSATDYTDYYIKGSRKNYDSVFKGVFDPITKLAIAECVEGKGRFIDDLANGVFARCEDASWIHTGHLIHYGDETIPRYDGKYLDIRSCSTGKQLSIVYYLLGDELRKFSPYLVERMEKEIKTRVLDIYLETDQWWTNLNEGHIINNWNTHCNECVITTAMIMERDKDRLVKIIAKAMKSLDVFYSLYEEDGACNEGPGYWKGSALSFIGIIRMLSELYSLKPENIINNKVRNMGNYICKVFIHRDMFMSYADGDGRNPMFDVKLYLAGNLLNEQTMLDMAIDVFNRNREKEIYYEHFVYILSDYLEYVFSYNKLFKESTLVKGKSHYMINAVLPDSNIFAARKKEGSKEGFFIGIKGGHNDESHNHNDIGCPFVYLNGEPVIIDPAAGTYTSKTFSPDRYDIWTMQSAWHSLPVINGFMQGAGQDYQSGAFKWSDDGSCAWASMEISKAYPNKAGIKSFTRKITLDRNKNEVLINDSIKLEKPSKDLVFHITLNNKPEICETGSMQLCMGEKEVALSYNDLKLTANITVMDLTYDKKLSNAWGQQIYRIDFKVTEADDEFDLEFHIKTVNL